MLERKDLAEELIRYGVDSFSEFLDEQALLKHKGRDDLLGLMKHCPEVANEPFCHFVQLLMHQNPLFLHLPDQHSQPSFQVLNPLILTIAATAALKFIVQCLNHCILCIKFFGLMLYLLLQFPDQLGLSRDLVGQLPCSPLKDTHQCGPDIVYLRVIGLNCWYYFS